MAPPSPAASLPDPAGLDLLLSREGWPYASAPPTEPGDPGRFHALFGRDSLITSLQLLPVRPEVARATLRALAARQGTVADPVTGEEPGKIGHEYRAEPPASFLASGFPDRRPFRYYATADATAWFVVLLAACADDSLTENLAAHWQAAGRWLAGALDAGDGLVRHGPGPAGGLGQQGWRDTIDPATDANGGGILRPDGTSPTPPLADMDTQAVTVAGLRALTSLSGDPSWAGRAERLVARLSQLGPEVLAVEAGDRAVPGAGSHLGWLLWADALDAAATERAADRLIEPDILTDYGVRTLSSRSPVFRGDGYHRGSVWPFDCWLAWGGLRAAGRDAAAARLRSGVLAALDLLGRYPELYTVGADGRPATLPVANRVQAWTVGARWALANQWDGRVGRPARSEHG